MVCAVLPVCRDGFGIDVSREHDGSFRLRAIKTIFRAQEGNDRLLGVAGVKQGPRELRVVVHVLMDRPTIDVVEGFTLAFGERGIGCWSASACRLRGCSLRRMTKNPMSAAMRTIPMIWIMASDRRIGAVLSNATRKECAQIGRAQTCRMGTRSAWVRFDSSIRGMSEGMCDNA